MKTAPLMDFSLAQVLESRTFERAPALRSLLAYLWEHREETLSEYAIATEALGRSAIFDAKVDATVRVQISRLRQRLEKYYEDEGQAQTERIVIPLGSHQIRIESVAVPAIVPVIEVATRRSPVVFSLGLACAVLVLTCVGLAAALWLRHGPAKPPETPQEVTWFWKAFFANGRPTRIILPTPLFYSFTRKAGDKWGAIMLRDTQINEFSKGSESAEYRMLEKTLGPPSLATNYTVTSDTFASVRLARYLDRSGLPTTVLSSADAPLEALDSENVIALGTWGTLSSLQPYLDRMNYVLGAHEVAVDIRHPGPGDPQKTEYQPESPERSIWPGVIGVLPGRSGHTHLLVLASRQTSALVAFLTSTNGLDQLERLWKAKGSPQYFETIVQAEMDGSKLVRTWPEGLRPFHGTDKR
ncbi:MAG TPA: helix-turn-helix domain-containing protein [Bryobacteraceae bacterium]|jgi:hypothetical protein